MASCKFDFPASQLTQFIHASEKIKKWGGSFEGDAQRGSFSLPIIVGTLRGHYEVTGGLIHVHITDKPMLLSCERIRKEMAAFIGL